jgi:hypothetical protein
MRNKLNKLIEFVHFAISDNRSYVMLLIIAITIAVFRHIKN